MKDILKPEQEDKCSELTSKPDQEMITAMSTVCKILAAPKVQEQMLNDVLKPGGGGIKDRMTKQGGGK